MDEETRRVGNKIEISFLSWFEIARIRRSPSTASGENRNELGTPMPLARAVRDAIAMRSRETVSIMMVRPRAGMDLLGDREIMRLSRREDYPYRPDDAEQPHNDKDENAGRGKPWRMGFFQP